MRRLTGFLLLATALAGCGGSSHRSSAPESAYLTDVVVDGATVRFEFESRPLQVRARYESRTRLAECGSGKPIRLRGAAVVVVHFLPAASAKIHGDQVELTYNGPKHLTGPGPVLEAVKSCDFESDLGWALGVERRVPIDVSRDGASVTLSFRKP